MDEQPKHEMMQEPKEREVWNVDLSIRIMIMHSIWSVLYRCGFAIYLCMHGVCVQLSVTLLYVTGSFLNADDSLDFSCEWMKALSYDGVHMQVPSLHRKQNSPGSLSLLASLSNRAPTKIHTASPCIHFICPLMQFSRFLPAPLSLLLSPLESWCITGFMINQNEPSLWLGECV